MGIDSLVESPPRDRATSSTFNGPNAHDLRDRLRRLTAAPSQEGAYEDQPIGPAQSTSRSELAELSAVIPPATSGSLPCSSTVFPAFLWAYSSGHSHRVEV